MILRHSALYFIARGVPGLIGFMTVVAFSRLLSPESYGQYALVVSGATLVTAICYEWLGAALLRFFPRHDVDSGKLLSTIFTGYLAISAAIGTIAILAVLLIGDQGIVALVTLCVILAWTQGWLKLNLDLIRSRLDPVRYGIIGSLKALLAFGFGIALIYSGFAAYGAIVGLAAGIFLAGIIASHRQWGHSTKIIFHKDLAIKTARYALPLMASFVLAVIVTVTDRFMIAWMIDEHATGLYAASQGVAKQAVGVTMTMISLAAYPIIVRALEDEGAFAVREKVEKNAILLLSVGIPITVLFVMLSEEISVIVLGDNFRASAKMLMPWFAVAALVTSLRTFYFDLAFFLGKKTDLLIVILAVSAGVNIGLNLYLIPKHGLQGAVYASVVAHVIATVLSALLGRRAFPLRTNYADLSYVVISGGMMAAAISLAEPGDSVAKFIATCLFGGATFVVCMLVLNPGNLRAAARNFVNSLTGDSQREEGM